MGMAVVLSHITFVEANPRFQTGCRTRLSLYPQSSLLTLNVPPGVVPTEVASIDVRPGEATNTPEREAPATVIETDNSKAGDHLFTAEVGLGNEPDFST